MIKSTSILFLTLLLSASIACAQSEVCDSIHSYPDTEASFGEGKMYSAHFFREHLLELIYDPDSDDFPPTSFKMILIVNDRDEVVSISKIVGNYSEETKRKILEILQKEKWHSAEVNGQKVCSEYRFWISCILWD